MVTKTYTVSTDIPSGKVNLDTLWLELEAQSIPVTGSMENKGNLSIDFSSEPDDIDLANVINAHSGDVIQEYKYHASSKMIEGEVEITLAGGEWELIGGVITNMSFFVEDLTRIVAKVVGEYYCTGGGAKLKVMEEQDGVASMLTPAPFICDDTEGAWEKFTLYNSALPRVGESTIRLEADKNGSTSSKFRFVSVTLLEAI